MRAMIALAIVVACLAGAVLSKPEAWPRSAYCGPLAPSEMNVPDPTNSSLKHVAVIIRHGDRTPIGFCWPNDNEWSCNLRHEERMNADVSFTDVPRIHRKNYINGRNINRGNCASGALTLFGYKQHLQNGRNLRGSYVHNRFLSPYYNHNEISIRSTDLPRTFASVEGLLLGMYPIDPQFPNTQMINISTIDLALEYMFPNADACSKVGLFQQQFLASAEYKAHVETVTIPLVRDLNAALGVNITGRYGDVINGIFDCVNAHACHGFPLPASIDYDLFQRINAEQMWYYGNVYSYPDRVTWSKYAIGGLIFDINNAFLGSYLNKTTIKMSIFSGHDTTIMPVLQALGAWDGQWASYASRIAIELWQSNGADKSLSVRVYYNNDLLKLPGCADTTCTWNEWNSITSPVTLSDPASQCH